MSLKENEQRGKKWRQASKDARPCWNRRRWGTRTRTLAWARKEARRRGNWSSSSFESFEVGRVRQKEEYSWSSDARFVIGCWCGQRTEIFRSSSTSLKTARVRASVARKRDEHCWMLVLVWSWQGWCDLRRIADPHKRTYAMLMKEPFEIVIQMNGRWRNRRVIWDNELVEIRWWLQTWGNDKVGYWLSHGHLILDASQKHSLCCFVTLLGFAYHLSLHEFPLLYFLMNNDHPIFSRKYSIYYRDHPNYRSRWWKYCRNPNRPARPSWFPAAEWEKELQRAVESAKEDNDIVEINRATYAAEIQEKKEKKEKHQVMWFLDLKVQQ